jgi:hypothetical protein
LGSGNIDENAGSGVNNVEELDFHCQKRLIYPEKVFLGPYLHDSSTIVGNRLLAVLIHHQQITAIGTKGRSDGGLNSQTGINIGDDLTLALRSVGS